jgi:hypothetical protein
MAEGDPRAPVRRPDAAGASAPAASPQIEGMAQMHVASTGPTATPIADETAPEPPTRKVASARPSVRERSEAFEAQKRYMEERFRYRRPPDGKPSD